MRNTSILIVAAAVMACDVHTMAADLETACTTTQQLAAAVSDDIWRNDWRFFAPLWWAAPDPAADEAYCLQLIGSPVDISMEDSAHRAAQTCQLAVEAVRTRRLGVKITGHIGLMGAGWAVHDAILERHDVTASPHASNGCLARYYSDTRNDLRLVGGV